MNDLLNKDLRQKTKQLIHKKDALQKNNILIEKVKLMIEINVFKSLVFFKRYLILNHEMLSIIPAENSKL